MNGSTRHRIRITRDALTFSVGLAGIVWETIAEHTDRPLLLALFAAMIGVSAYGSTRAKLPDQEAPT